MYERLFVGSATYWLITVFVIAAANMLLRHAQEHGLDVTFSRSITNASDPADIDVMANDIISTHTRIVTLVAGTTDDEASILLGLRYGIEDMARAYVLTFR